jgi:hypothetical protein
MKVGIHISNFTWPGGAPQLASDLRRVATAAEDSGFARVSVMDHVWQIGPIGPPEHEMLEAYGGGARSRPALPVDEGAIRAARGSAGDLSADVERQRDAIRGQALPA